MRIATDEMKDDIIDLKKRGEIAQDEFIERFTKENSTLTYYDPIKWQQFKLFEKKIVKNKQSFTEIFATFDQKKLDYGLLCDK